MALFIYVLWLGEVAVRPIRLLDRMCPLEISVLGEFAMYTGEEMSRSKVKVISIFGTLRRVRPLAGSRRNDDWTDVRRCLQLGQGRSAPDTADRSDELGRAAANHNFRRVDYRGEDGHPCTPPERTWISRRKKRTVSLQPPTIQQRCRLSVRPNVYTKFRRSLPPWYQPLPTAATGSGELVRAAANRNFHRVDCIFRASKGWFRG
ncbi:UNVERIFIED_CONTAM: hypothetical protein PYX00_005691 [Menopon gallinae]|uniref:Uncharacterized protein n=1 Tax=Menopon gallinae TaxID=328185 RepID=A0AAW2HU59_9NEOP